MGWPSGPRGSRGAGCVFVWRWGEITWGTVCVRESAVGSGWGWAAWGRAGLLVSGGYDGLRVVWEGAPSLEGSPVTAGTD